MKRRAAKVCWYVAIAFVFACLFVFPVRPRAVYLIIAGINLIAAIRLEPIAWGKNETIQERADQHDH